MDSHSRIMFTIKTYCGGICLTNGYAIECPDG
ncbi:MAG: hypothetical protein ACI9R3_006607, partial [Verrucomicrobiales bacterium]